MGMIQMSPVQVVEKAKHDKTQVEKRVALTKACAEKLRDAIEGNADAESLLCAIIEAQLLQLDNALDEGREQIKMLDDMIAKMSSPLVGAQMVPPRGPIQPGRR